MEYVDSNPEIDFISQSWGVFYNSPVNKFKVNNKIVKKNMTIQKRTKEERYFRKTTR